MGSQVTTGSLGVTVKAGRVCVVPTTHGSSSPSDSFYGHGTHFFLLCQHYQYLRHSMSD